MKLRFDLNSIDVTAFGVGKDNGGGATFTEVPSDAEVQQALEEMVKATWQEMQAIDNSPDVYDPSEKHAAHEHLHLPLSHELAAAAKALHEAQNLPLDAQALKDPSKMFCYFARMVDTDGKRLTALRRASQFKGTLKSRLIRLQTDALKLVKEQIFRLDQDFDFLVDSAHVHILRPSGFEFAGKLQDAIMAAVPDNVAKIEKLAPFIDFTTIEAYALKHPRAARYIASIQTFDQCKGIDKRRLKKLCDATNVKYTEKAGKLSVEEAEVLGFLEVVDRRRYEVELVAGVPEKFKAASRKKLTAS